MSTQLLQEDPDDQRLRQQVHPSDWVNPTAAPRYHLVVIGGGTAGLVCAAGAAGLGARVALVERHLLGGDCLNAGCVPSKSLLAAAKNQPEDFPAAMQRLRRQRADLAQHDSAERFRSLGVDVFFGEGRFTSGQTLEVGGQTLRFRRAVIATGSRPRRPDFSGIDTYLTHEEIFTLTSRPERLQVIGGGPIGCEMAQAFARFGVPVTLVERSGRVLPREDEDASAVVQSVLVREGVRFVSRPEPGFPTTLVAVGRTPNLEGLGLEAAGVRTTEKGVEINDFLQTSNPRIYAAGDIASPFPFTHAADAMARLVVRNALFGGWGRLSRLVVPWCTYTQPEIGRVGLSQAEARERNIAVEEYVHPFSAVDRAVLEGHDEGFVRVLVRRATAQPIGVTAVGHQVGEILGIVALLMAQNRPLTDLSSAIFPYPTRNEVLRKLGDAANRRRLTPWVRWLLGWWMGRP
jgi:pyruvate/2-oxoglutarate dehydrogenase complex dihydrolipoamide dehydrogenase (E3) component